MLTVQRSRFTRSVVLPLTFLAFLSGCHKWSTVDTSPSAFFAEEQPDKVRVTWRGERYELRSPIIDASSITGATKKDSRFSVPLAEIEKLEAREADAWASIGIFAGSVALVSAVYIVIDSSDVGPLWGGS